MRGLISFFIKRPIWANSLLVLTVLLGGLSAYMMDTSFFPIQQPFRIGIGVVYPGASPIEIEEGITIKIEQALKGIKGIDEMYSSSSENVCRVDLRLHKDHDIDEVLRDVENAINSISSYPDGAEKPSVVKQRSFMNTRASFVSLSGDVGLIKLKETADQIEDDLLNTEAISQILKGGIPPREFSIEVSEEQLLRYNISLDDVGNAVRMSNRDISGGSVKAYEEEYLIRSKGKKITAKEIENIIIRGGTEGRLVRVSDVGSVTFDFEDSPIKSYINGKRNIYLSIMKLEDEDLGEISDAVAEYVEIFNKEHKDMRLDITFQFYDLLKQRINMLLNNGLIGLVLVLVILGLFLNIRLSFWVAMGIPISFLGMFIMGAVYGMTVNMISLFGMILVVGIIVDDGIVIAENIYAHYEKGESPYQSTLEGTMEVLPSVFTSIVTTIVAFSVLFFIEDMEQMNEMAFAVIACLVFSLIEAFFVLPSHLNSKNLKKKAAKTDKKNAIERGIDYVKHKIYGEILSAMMRKKWLRRTLTFVPLLFMITIGFFLKEGIIKSTFFPAIPFDDFQVEVAYKTGESVKKTEEYLKYIEQQVFEVKSELLEEYGDTLITFISTEIGNTEQLGEAGSHAGMIRVSLDIEDAEISSFDIANRVREKVVKDPSLEKFQVGGFNRWGSPVSIALHADDYREIKKAKNWLRTELSKNPALKNVKDNGGLGNREIILELKPKAFQLGLSPGEIMRQIRQGFFGNELQRMIVGEDEVKVWLRYPEKDRKSIAQMEEIKIRTPTGGQYALKELADYKIERGEVKIRHTNGKKEIMVTADKTDAYASTSDVNDKIDAEIIPKLKALFPKIEVEFRGQARSAGKSMKSLGIMAVLLLIMIVLILSLNFNSLYQGLMFAVIIPMGMFCAQLGHGIEHLPFSVLSFWGVIALMGILVNDAVVFLDTFNRYLKQGMEVKTAIFEAGVSRFRPIVLTSITTIAGLYPLIWESDFQAQFLIPMAVSVAYGVLFGTLFILFFFPLLVLFFNDMKRAWIWLWTGDKPDSLSVESAVIDMKKEEALGLEEDSDK